MADLIIRNVSDETKQQLKIRAAQNNRSMEAELRSIINETLNKNGFAEQWLKLSEKFRDGPELELPERSSPREFDLS